MFVDLSAQEETEAARLEWIKVYGVLLGCEAEANAYYETVAAPEVDA
jgi:iron complex transport system substrate-binding protein